MPLTGEAKRAYNQRHYQKRRTEREAGVQTAPRPYQTRVMRVPRSAPLGVLLHRFLGHSDIAALRGYQEHRADVLSALELQTLERMSELLADAERSKKLHLQGLAVAFGILDERRRLHLGESTANVQVHILIEQLSREARNRRPELQAVVVEAEGVPECDTEAK